MTRTIVPAIAGVALAAAFAVPASAHSFGISFGIGSTRYMEPAYYYADRGVREYVYYDREPVVVYRRIYRPPAGYYRDYSPRYYPRTRVYHRRTSYYDRSRTRYRRVQRTSRPYVSRVYYRSGSRPGRHYSRPGYYHSGSRPSRHYSRPGYYRRSPGRHGAFSIRYRR